MGKKNIVVMAALTGFAAIISGCGDTDGKAIFGGNGVDPYRHFSARSMCTEKLVSRQPYWDVSNANEPSGLLGLNLKKLSAHAPGAAPYLEIETWRNPVRDLVVRDVEFEKDRAWHSSGRGYSVEVQSLSCTETTPMGELHFHSYKCELKGDVTSPKGRWVLRNISLRNEISGHVAYYRPYFADSRCYTGSTHMKTEDAIFMHNYPGSSWTGPQKFPVLELW